MSKEIKRINKKIDVFIQRMLDEDKVHEDWREEALALLVKANKLTQLKEE